MKKWFAAIGIYHVLLSIYTLFFIKGGTMVGAANSMDQMNYIASHRAVFSLGWLGWSFATLSLVAFLFLMRQALGESRIMTFALIVVIIGATADIIGGVIYGGLLPTLTQGGETAPFSFEYIQFQSFEKLAVMLNAGLNNLMYALGGFILAAALERSRVKLGLVRYLNWATWISALGLSAAGFLLNEKWIFIGAAASMATFVGLCLALAVTDLRARSV